jgi:hypothetical protein
MYSVNIMFPHETSIHFILLHCILLIIHFKFSPSIDSYYMSAKKSSSGLPEEKPYCFNKRDYTRRSNANTGPHNTYKCSWEKNIPTNDSFERYYLILILKIIRNKFIIIIFVYILLSYII